MPNEHYNWWHTNTSSYRKIRQKYINGNTRPVEDPFKLEFNPREFMPLTKQIRQGLELHRKKNR